LLEGKSLRVARIEILRASLQIGAVSSTHLPQAEPDVVVRQDPPAGEKGTGSPRVNVLVSLGAEARSFVMPDFVGMTTGDAQRRIAGAGLRLSRITFVPAPGAPRGVVVQQIPARGSRIPAGAAVELQVAE
jgi:beta-lactam-binding protein with PASTA domain